MRQSNGYIIGFSLALTFVIGGALAIASEFFKPMEEANKKLEQMTYILKAAQVNIEGANKKEIEEIFSKRVVALTVNVNGDTITATNAKGNAIEPTEVDVKTEFKKVKAGETESMDLPLYKIKSDWKGDGAYDAYVFPMWGAGLWDYVNGYIAVADDYNTIIGVVFDHKSETPGLGARITDKEIQERFEGKKIYNEEGELQSVEFLKGEGNSTEGKPHKVDGLSGASMTTQGVNKMLETYFGLYNGFFQKQKKNGNKTTSGAVEQTGPKYKSNTKLRQ